VDLDFKRTRNETGEEGDEGRGRNEEGEHEKKKRWNRKMRRTKGRIEEEDGE
jgi:hypothetical protein